MDQPPPEPIAGECLPCYVARMLRDGEPGSACDGTWRWAERFRELRSPDAAGMERRLGRAGATCDCTIFVSELTLARHQLVRDVHTDELEQPAEPPDCAAVRSTSTHPCRNWVKLPKRRAAVDQCSVVAHPEAATTEHVAVVTAHPTGGVAAS